MAQETLHLLDTTLRESAQSEGISFSVEDKQAIYQALRDFGIPLIEAGNPGSNQKDRAFFQYLDQTGEDRSHLAAFGATCRVGEQPGKDPQCLDLLHSGAPTVVLFGKSSAFQVREVLRCAPEENLRMIRETVAFFKEQGKQVVYDAEHFFDGAAEHEEYALRTLEAAAEGGADVLCLCDTNGGVFPEQVARLTALAAERFSGREIGIHCHNDSGLATANSLAAVRAGARHVQGTFLGYGERCGNASLCTLIGTLQLKLGYRCVPEKSLRRMTRTARYLAEICNVALPAGQPYVGSAAFAHKAGMHADGVRKTAAAFEHVPPESVGNHRRFLVSEIAGRALLLEKIRAAVPEAAPTEEQLSRIAMEIKELEFGGYQFEAAEASFELLVRRHLGLLRPRFELLVLRTIGEHPARGGSATAVIKVRVGTKEETSAAEGNGPVNALDRALRRALEVFYPQVSEMRLSDFKVRVIDSRDATAARVRVLITSTDGKNTWTTVGVSGDVIEASFQALKDSIDYKLLEVTA